MKHLSQPVGTLWWLNFALTHGSGVARDFGLFVFTGAATLALLGAVA